MVCTAPVALIPFLAKFTAREPATELKASVEVRVSDAAVRLESVLESGSRSA